MANTSGVTKKGRPAADHPDLQLPGPGAELGAVSVRVDATADLVQLIETLRETGAEIVAINTFPATRGEPEVVRVFDFELRGVDSARAADRLRTLRGVVRIDPRNTLGQIFGKRVIVIGGGAQVGMVAQGAVSEADRHNIRGERISVDTIPLVGEEQLADAVRAVARLHRARVLVLAGALMGGDISNAVREIRQAGIIVVCTNMAGSVPEAADLVVSDPVEAGVMAVMLVADTARFSIEHVRGRRF